MGGQSGNVRMDLEVWAGGFNQRGMLGTNLTEGHLNWLLRSDQAKSTRTRNYP